MRMLVQLVVLQLQMRRMNRKSDSEDGQSRLVRVLKRTHHLMSPDKKSRNRGAFAIS